MKHYELDGHEVALLREQQGMSQADLAEKCGVNPSYMSLLESGGRQPSSAVTFKIASALGVAFAAITRTKGLEPASAAS
jgi:transcriptional regulator with XRE-family HTH domain